MAKLLLFLLLLCAINLLINAIFFDHFDCKIPACRKFGDGSKDWPRRIEYKAACSDTVAALQAIPRTYGKCINEKTRRPHPPCIYELGRVIKKCIQRLYDLPEKDARFYCGYTLMKHCAVHLGLADHPLDFKY